MALLAAPLLVPRDPAPPAGLAAATFALEGGLPAAFRLDGRTTLVVTLPTGDLRRWQRADPAAVVSRGDDEVAPLRLALVSDGVPVAWEPVVRGRRLLLPATGRALVEAVLTDWTVMAGDVVGPGRRGGFVALAWRRVDAGAPRFAAPTARPDVMRRLVRRDLDGSAPVADPKPGGLDWERRHGRR